MECVGSDHDHPHPHPHSPPPLFTRKIILNVSQVDFSCFTCLIAIATRVQLQVTEVGKRKSTTVEPLYRVLSSNVIFNHIEHFKTGALLRLKRKQIL